MRKPSFRETDLDFNGTKKLDTPKVRQLQLLEEVLHATAR